jgi:hypothetical protein
LLLDEPTTGLDPQARHLMWERLQLLLQQGKSILLTTHFMDEAERLCSRLLVLDHGARSPKARPRDLIAQHLEPDVVEVYGVGATGPGDSPVQGSWPRASRSAARPCSSTRTCARPAAGAGRTRTAYPAPPRQSGGPVPQADRPPDPGGRMTDEYATPLPPRRIDARVARPQLSLRFWPVFQRNLLVWRKLAIPSLVGNIAEPLMWLVAFGYGLGALVGQVTVADAQADRCRCPTSCSWPAAASA